MSASAKKLHNRFDVPDIYQSIRYRNYLFLVIAGAIFSPMSYFTAIDPDEQIVFMILTIFYTLVAFGLILNHRYLVQLFDSIMLYLIGILVIGGFLAIMLTPKFPSYSKIPLLIFWLPFFIWHITLYYHNNVKKGLVVGGFLYLLTVIAISHANASGYNYIKAFDVLIFSVIFMVICHSFYGLNRFINDEASKNKKAEIQTITDSLTGVQNRRAFEAEFEKQRERASYFRSPLCLMLLDIDYFKTINDTYGHAVGDEVLKELTRVICSQLHKDVKVFRWGGEEFSILLSLPLSAAVQIAQNIREAVEKHVFSHNIHLTISIGITLCPESLSSIGCFLNADQALYKAKQCGRNRVEISDE